MVLTPVLEKILSEHNELFPDDWLLQLEGLEILKQKNLSPSLAMKVEMRLREIGHRKPTVKGPIEDGLRWIMVP